MAKSKSKKKPAAAKAEPAKEATDAKGTGIPPKAEAPPKAEKVKTDPDVLGPKEAWFEAPDGRKFKGPADQTSIKVKGIPFEINQMRKGGTALARHKALHNDPKTNGRIK